MKHYPNRACADCGEAMINPQPNRAMCPACSATRNKVRGRERYYNRIVPVKPVAKPTLNCLQCRHCALLPQTDFTKRGTSIYCNAAPPGEAIGERVVNLGGCPSAEPMPVAGRGGVGRQWSVAADKLLRDLLPVNTKARRDKLLSLVGKTRHGARKRARKLGVKWDLPSEEIARICRHSAQQQKPHFTPAQWETILSYYESNNWPRAGAQGYAHGDVQRALRAEIIARVNALGEPRSWRAIQRSVYELSPRGRRIRADTYARKAKKRATERKLTI